MSQRAPARLPFSCVVPFGGAALGFATVAMAATWCAAAEGAELSWTAPAACPDQEAVALDVEHLLGTPLEAASSLSIRVEVFATEGGFRAEVSSGRGATASTRHLEASTCAKLVEMVSLSVTLSLSATQGQQEPGGVAPRGAAPAVGLVPVSSVPNDLDPASDAPVEGPAVEDTRQPSHLPRLGPLIAAVGDSGSLPAPTLGLSGGLGLAWPELELRAIGTFFLAREERVEVSGTSSPGARLRLLEATLSGCTPISQSSSVLPLKLCAGFSMGRVSGRGLGVTRTRSDQTLWLAPGVDLETDFGSRDDRLRLIAALGVEAPLLRDEFVLEGIGPMHQADAIVGRARVGAFFNFW